MIICTDNKGGYARDGKIPWDLPLDRKLFWDVTHRQKCGVLAGPKTAPLIKPDSKRQVFVVYDKESYEFAMHQCKIAGLKPIFAGGRGVYKMGEDSKEWWWTKINKDYKCDRHYLPDFKPNRTYIFDGVEYSMRVDIVNPNELAYLDTLYDILQQPLRPGRNGFVRQKFGVQLEFDLTTFPLLTTKRMFLRGIAEELFFFLRGETDTTILSKRGVHIWEANTSAEWIKKMGLDLPPGDMGPMYGYQWRKQLPRVIEKLRTSPESRRILMTTYNPEDADKGVLYPCHGISIIFEVYEGALSCHMTQRSGDMFLGVPFNIASYALLVYILAKYVGLKPGKLVIAIAHAHIYKEHEFVVKRQILRNPFTFPTLELHVESPWKMKWSDLELKNYKCYSKLKAPMIA